MSIWKDKLIESERRSYFEVTNYEKVKRIQELETSCGGLNSQLTELLYFIKMIREKSKNDYYNTQFNKIIATLDIVLTQVSKIEKLTYHTSKTAQELIYETQDLKKILEENQKALPKLEGLTNLISERVKDLITAKQMTDKEMKLHLISKAKTAKEREILLELWKK